MKSIWAFDAVDLRAAGESRCSTMSVEIGVQVYWDVTVDANVSAAMKRQKRDAGRHEVSSGQEVPNPGCLARNPCASKG